jgi:arsenate reductase
MAEGLLSLDEFTGQEFDYVITFFDDAKETCPVFPGKTRHVHWSTDDPTAVQGSDEERTAAFRRIRGELQERISAFLWTRPDLHSIRKMKA